MTEQDYDAIGRTVIEAEKLATMPRAATERTP